tara:strand:+ start:12474 stop:12614 length:141 start_codon:yes stop_codon:yes gene_type:complete
MKRFYSLEYWQDEGWYVGKLKEVPGIFSQGKKPWTNFDITSLMRIS